MALSNLTPAQILERIRYDPETKMGSVYDVIRIVTGYAQKDIAHEYQGICKKFPDLMEKIQYFKFPGQGQRPTPVAYLNALMEIAWLCPGRHAKEFRRTGAVTLCRALGGDLSLVEEIRHKHGEVAHTEEQSALLAGTGVTTAEANGQAIVPADAQLDRYKAETAKIWAEAKQLQLSTFKEAEALATRLKQEAVDEEDVRHRIELQDMSANLLRMYAAYATGTLAPMLTDGARQNEPVTLSGVAADMGHRLTRAQLIAVGREASRLYRQKYDEPPPKHVQYVDGAVRHVASYFQKDRALIETAIRDVLD
jgi:hypothetical protein